MKFSKTLLAAGVLSLTAGSVSALESEFGGQVNRAIMYAEDGYDASNLGKGSDTEIYHVDNRNSPSRFFFGGTQRLFEGWTAGAEIEVGVFSSASNDVDPDEKLGEGPEIDERITDAFIDTPYGKVTLGLGEGAAYNVGRRDYSGTGVISFRNPNLIGGSLRFEAESYTKARFNTDGTFNRFLDADKTNPDPNESSIAGSIRDYNFEGRHNRIRYDSPRIGPVTLSVSAGHDGDDGHDSVLQFGVKSGLRVPGGRVLIGAGYSRATQNSDDDSNLAAGDDPDVNIYGGSVSYFHSDTGLNLSLAAVNRAEEIEDDDLTSGFEQTDSELGQFRYAKLGYRPNRQHAFDVHYGQTKGRNKADEKGSVVGIGYVWSPSQQFDLYAGAKIHSFERGDYCSDSGRTCYSIEYNDIKIATTGLRVKF